MLANGVVMVRETGQPNDTALPLRQALNEGALLGPEMVATGWILDGDPPFIPQASHGVKTPEEGRAEVRRQAAAGVDQIKVYSKLEKDVFTAICDEALRVGLKPVGHVPEAVYLEDAVAAGMRSIEHVHGFDKVVGRLLGEPIILKSGGMGVNFDYWPRLAEVDPNRLGEVLGRIRASGVVVCPTVIVFKSQAGLGDVSARTYAGHEYISPLIQGIWDSLWNPANRAEMETLWPPIAAFVGALHKSGIPLMIGTDVTMPGVIPGFAVHEEMAVWQEAGIPPADILRSATIVPARFLDRDQRLGTIAAGKIASLALVRGNPLEDIRHAEKIEGLFLKGRFFSRADLDQLLKEARDLAGQGPGPADTPGDIEMVAVPGGVFMMGSNSGDEDEKPVHQVTVRAFHLSRTEVTVGQWRAFVEATGYRSEAENGEGAYVWAGKKYEMRKGVCWDNPGYVQSDDRPVTCVSWNDAQAFIKWLNGKTGKSCRLPTEAEWEYACRAGAAGDTAGDMDAAAWYVKNSGQSPHPVGQKQANAFKLSDMLGNVWEWCADWEGAYPDIPASDPAGPDSGTRRVTRGAGWLSLAEYVRPADRAPAPPNIRAVDLGFRLASD